MRQQTLGVGQPALPRNNLRKQMPGGQGIRIGGEHGAQVAVGGAQPAVGQGRGRRLQARIARDRGEKAVIGRLGGRDLARKQRNVAQ